MAVPPSSFSYVGRNHSDSTLVMCLPREKIIFVVDLLPVGRMPGRGMIDFYPMEAEQSIKRILAMDWERLIPGHPDGGRLGNKKSVEEQLELLQLASVEGKRLGQAGKCWLPGEKEFTIAGYEKLQGYARRTAVRRPALLRPVGPRHLKYAAPSSKPNAKD